MSSSYYVLIQYQLIDLPIVVQSLFKNKRDYKLSHFLATNSSSRNNLVDSTLETAFVDQLIILESLQPTSTTTTTDNIIVEINTSRISRLPAMGNLSSLVAAEHVCIICVFVCVCVCVCVPRVLLRPFGAPKSSSMVVQSSCIAGLLHVDLCAR
mmetsp:Transcript_2788/g.6095  ORF Transcript_2788/g.6095 Transcript_2788/m.6095 type:complete len:154 (-) Transcript_2788:2097-2558(-)